MFSGLNKFIKIILPKRLFYRALIIVAAPTIILQIINANTAIKLFQVTAVNGDTKKIIVKK